MNIRHATEKDLDSISKIDQSAYGDYGGSKEYFAKKLNALQQGMLVAEENGKITGAIVFEAIQSGSMPEDFHEFKLAQPIKGKWMYVPIFTTATNYADKKSDAQLLLAAEKIAKQAGCTESCVPLTKDHPFKGNGVFEFWASNGYQKTGTVKWVPGPNEAFECWLYRKKL